MAKIERRIIKWNPRASTRVRNCAEPYDLGPVYQPSKADPTHRKRGYNSHAVVDEQVQRGKHEINV